MNSSWLTFHPVFPVWVILLVTVPAFGFFLWKEITRTHRFLVIRIIAQVLILASILGLLLQPSYRELKSISDVLLLTHGYSKSKVDSLVKVNPTIQIVRTSETESYPNSEVISSYQKLSDYKNSNLTIVGEGLPDYAFELLENNHVSFISSGIPYGVVNLSLPKTITVNKKHSIHGKFNASEKTTLKLVSPAGVEDSVVLKQSGISSFTLSFKPRQAGLFVFHLEYITSNKLISEKLPLEIREEKKLQILSLQKFPTAEIRYLKNYLVEKGHSVALRYQTSKSNFKFEYGNMNSVGLDKISSELLNSFDLLLIDRHVLDELASSEKVALDKAIQQGLGVIVLMDDIKKNDKTLNRLLPLSTNQLTTDTVRLALSNSQAVTLPVLPIEIKSADGLQIIHQHGGRILSGYLPSGFGKVGFQLLQETYRLGLEGKPDDYSFIWSTLIEQTARTKNEAFKISLENLFPIYPDEPLALTIISSGDTPSLHDDHILLPLSEDVMIDDYWHGKSWAGKLGWHQFSIPKDSTELNYFVSEPKEWNSLRIANQIKSNQLAQTSDSKVKASTEYGSKTISPLLFYLLFSFAAGFLWLAPKI